MSGWRDDAGTYAEYRALVEGELRAAYQDATPMHRRRAARLVAREVARAKRGLPGVVKPSSCDRCGRAVSVQAQLHGHHVDYARPLHVVWLCVWCHRAVHLGEPLGVDRPPAEPTRLYASPGTPATTSPAATGSATGRTSRERTATGGRQPSAAARRADPPRRDPAASDDSRPFPRRPTTDAPRR